MNPPDPQSVDSTHSMSTPSPSVRPAVDEVPLDSGSEIGTILIPLIEEQIQVQKQVVETGRIRLVKTVDEQTETVRTPYQQEQLTVERVAINQYVTEAPVTRQEGDTTIYSVLKEIVVVEKRLLLVEEVHIRRQQLQAVDEQHVSLRREHIAVERDDLPNERSV